MDRSIINGSIVFKKAHVSVNRPQKKTYLFLQMKQGENASVDKEKSTFLLRLKGIHIPRMPT